MHLRKVKIVKGYPYVIFLVKFKDSKKFVKDFSLFMRNLLKKVDENYKKIVNEKILGFA